MDSITQMQSHPLYAVARELLRLRDVAFLDVDGSSGPARLAELSNLLNAHQHQLSLLRDSRDERDEFILSIIMLATAQQLKLVKSAAESNQRFRNQLEELQSELDALFLRDERKRRRSCSAYIRSRSLDSAETTSSAQESKRGSAIRGRALDRSEKRARSASEGARVSRPNHPQWKTQLLFAWFYDNRHYPYPSEGEKRRLCEQTDLNLTQLNNWFINGASSFRIRL